MSPQMINITRAEDTRNAARGFSTGGQQVDHDTKAKIKARVCYNAGTIRIMISTR